MHSLVGSRSPLHDNRCLRHGAVCPRPYRRWYSAPVADRQPSAAMASPTPAHSFLSRAFAAHGARLAAHPFAHILASIAIVAALSGGVALVTIDSNPDAVWVPPSSQTARQKAYFDVAFDPFFRINQLIVTYDDDCVAATAGDGGNDVGMGGSWAVAISGQDGRVGGGNAVEEARGGSGTIKNSWWERGVQRLQSWVATAGSGSSTAPSHMLRDSGGCPANATSPASGILTTANLVALLALQEAIVNATDSAGTSLADICYRPIAGKGCLIQTPLDYFRSDPALVAASTPATIQDALECRDITDFQTTTPCVNAIGVPVMPPVVQGGIGCLHQPVPGE